MSSKKERVSIEKFVFSDNSEYKTFHFNMLGTANKQVFMLNRKERKVSFLLRELVKTTKDSKVFTNWVDVKGFSIAVNDKGRLNFYITADRDLAKMRRNSKRKQTVNPMRVKSSKVLFNASQTVEKCYDLFSDNFHRFGVRPAGGYSRMDFDADYLETMEKAIPGRSHIPKPIMYLLYKETADLLQRTGLTETSLLELIGNEAVHTQFFKELSQLVSPGNKFMSRPSSNSKTPLYCVNNALRQTNLHDFLNTLSLRSEKVLRDEIVAMSLEDRGNVAAFLCLTKSYLTEEERLNELDSADDTLGAVERINMMNNAQWRNARQALKIMPPHIRFSYIHNVQKSSSWFASKSLNEGIIKANLEGEYENLEDYLKAVENQNKQIDDDTVEAEQALADTDFFSDVKKFGLSFYRRKEAPVDDSEYEFYQWDNAQSFDALVAEDSQNAALRRISAKIFKNAGVTSKSHEGLTRESLTQFEEAVTAYLTKALKRNDVEVTSENISLLVACLVMINRNDSVFPDYRGVIPTKVYEYLKDVETPTRRSVEILIKSKVKEYSALKAWLDLPNMFLSGLGMK